MIQRNLLLFFILLTLIVTPTVNAKSIIIVNHDEWTLSNTGFAKGDAQQFALNIGNIFTDNQVGNFLVYSSNFGLTESKLTSTMTGAGHSWKISTSEDISLSNLMQYDAIFLAGNSMDNSILIDYVNSGGNVYLAGGTTSTSGVTANRWNVFLNNFGLNYAVSVNNVGGTKSTTSTHSLFDGVNSLYYVRGNYVSLLDPSNPNTIVLEGTDVNGLIAMYNPVLKAGWSMISLPVVPESLTLSDVFPDAEVVYRYDRNGGYVRVQANEELEAGKGYWILLNEAQTYALTGECIQEYPLSVEDGWYMIGGCTDPAQVIPHDCEVGVIYGYVQGAGYQPVTGNLEPGKGYWILINNATPGATISVETVD